MHFSNEIAEKRLGDYIESKSFPFVDDTFGVCKNWKESTHSSGRRNE